MKNKKAQKNNANSLEKLEVNSELLALEVAKCEAEFRSTLTKKQLEMFNRFNSISTFENKVKCLEEFEKGLKEGMLINT